jgi:chromosome segregation ATPase
MDQQISDKRSQLSSLTGREDKLNTRVAGLETRDKELKASNERSEKEYESWKKETAKEKAELQQKSDALKAALEKDGLELDRIDSALSGLKSKNVTIETITRIREMEFQADENLLERVKTAADLKKVKTELAQLKEKKTKTHEEIAHQESTLKGLREDTSTEKNSLDEWRLKTRSYQQAVSIAGWFFSQGYKTDDLKTIKNAIELVSIKGNTALSIDRLVRGIEEAGSLANIREEITRSKAELNTLREETASAKGKLAAIKDTVIKAIDDTTVDAVLQIGGIRETGASDITLLKDEAVKALDGVKAKATDSLAATQTKASEGLIELLKQCGGILTAIQGSGNLLSGQLQVVVKDTNKDLMEKAKGILEGIQTASSEMAIEHKARLVEWGRIQADAAKLAVEVKRANALFGFEHYSDGLALLGKDEIALLISRIIRWSALPSWTIQPTAELRQLTTRYDLQMFATVKFDEALNWALALLNIGQIGQRIRL